MAITAHHTPSRYTGAVTAPDPRTAPIFVVGTGRSGTTLLRMMISAHPRVYLTHEASFYIFEQGFAWKQGAERLIEHYVRSFSFRWLFLGPELLDEVPPLTRDNVGELYTAVMRAKAAQYGKPRWGDKTPSHTANLDRIFEDFPDARVIRIVRDPRDVVASLARMPWATDSINGGTTLCRMEHRQSLDYTDRIHKVRLEDLIADPRAVMEGVLAFVGEAWSEQVLDHPTHGPPASDVPPVPWFESATRAPKKGPVEPRWKKAYTPAQIRLIEEQTAECLDADGYPRAELAEEPGRAAVWMAWLRDLPGYWRFLWVFLRLAWASKDTTRSDEANRPLLRQLNPQAWANYPGFEMPDNPPLGEGWDEALEARRR